jgi:cell wall-associated NlpC family hydrolase
MAAVAAFFPVRRAKPRFRAELLAYAQTLLDVQYEINLDDFEPRIPGSRGWGKIYPRPDFGLDCSGYVLKVLQHMGLLTDRDPLTTNCNGIWSRCEEISPASARPGDLVFFSGTYNTSGFSHIGFVTEAGGTRMISARIPRVGFDVLPGSWQKFAPRYARVKGMPD